MKNTEEVKKIDLIIEALYECALKAAKSNDIREYSIDDGITSISRSYKGVGCIMQDIKSMKELKQICLL